MYKQVKKQEYIFTVYYTKFEETMKNNLDPRSYYTVVLYYKNKN